MCSPQLPLFCHPPAPPARSAEYCLLLATFGAIVQFGLEGGIAAGIVLATLYFALAYAQSQVWGGLALRAKQGGRCYRWGAAGAPPSRPLPPQRALASVAQTSAAQPQVLPAPSGNAHQVASIGVAAP